MTHTLSEQNTNRTWANPDKDGVSQSDKGVSSARSQRLVIFNGHLDWEHEKWQYVHLVTAHMNENRADQDIMTELLNLMTRPADQTKGSNCRHWQHPSDLTRRNYQRRFGNSLAKITLSEWQAQNHYSYQRFGKL
ncbi:S100P-binding protein-like [Channa argus]|uniref:S100P-binding protein-like n=1 Tax=Channa argus TaxID=215402 RepID=UPI003522E30C